MKSKGLTILSIILSIIIIALCVGIFLVYRDGQKREDENKQLKTVVSDLENNSKKLENKIEELEEELEKEKNKPTEEDKENVKEAFEKYLEEKGGLEEYTIESVKILDKEELENEYGEDILHGEDSIPAEVNYSVKPLEEKFDEWIAGNGEADGEWICEKYSVIEVKKTENGYSVISAGTSW